MRSRHTDWHTFLNCFVLPNITGITPVIKVDISNWMILKDIKHADEQLNEPGNIDLLLGADLFYEMSRPGRYTHPRDYPVIQETALGWTIAGRNPATTNPNNTTLEEAKRAFIQRETSKLDYIIKHHWNVKPAEPPTITGRQNTGEEPRHSHKPIKDERGVNRCPTNMDPTYLGNSHLAAERRSSITDIKLGRGPKRKLQYHNSRKNCEETRPKKSVRFQEGNKIHHGPPSSNSMDSVTAVNEPMEPVCTCAPQTTQTSHFVNSCASHQRWHH
jgi:hypothetical protein